MPRRVRTSAPRVTFMTAEITPGKEVGVIVLSAGFKQMRMIRDHLCHNALALEFIGQRPLPKLNRPPWLPQKIKRAAEDVVSCRHTR